MASLLAPPCAHLTLYVSQLPPSFPVNTPTKQSFIQSSSSTSPIKRASPSTTHLNIVRWIILVISSVCLILDIIAVHLLLYRPHLPHGLSFTASQPDQNSQPSFFSLLVFRLVPDIMVISLMSMLLWKRIQLPNRLWSLHTFCRVLFSTVIMAFALFSPIAEFCFALERIQGWAIYVCQIRQGGSLRTEDNWAQNCAVLRARSALTVMWVFLVLVEIYSAYRAKEFQSLESNRKHGHWSNDRTDRLIKASMGSSREVWSEEIVRVHDDDQDEIDVDGNNESDNDSRVSLRL